MTYRKAYEKLEAVGQLHVLEHYDSLSETQKKNLLEDIALTDFTVLSYLEKRDELMRKGVITPLAAMELPEIERSRAWFEELGCRAIRQGQVGAVLLANGRILEIVKNRGIEWLNVFAVDNVLQRMADPCFVGATIARGCSCGAKVVKKNAPDEKVGVMCLEDGRPSIVEYYDLTDELMHAKNENGEPAYNFGAILNYLFQVKALEQTISRELPLHIVEKKIPHMDDDGNFVEPDKPNGYKYETLVLDMVHMMDSCLPYEVKREYEFAPIKNMTGIDSVDTARELCRINGIEL